jgi:hypothetical protein
VRTELIPLFLQELTPFLYTTNARVQPNDPNTPLYNPNDGGSGGNVDIGAATATAAASAAMTVALGVLAAAMHRWA